jgi:hypothetical protein
MIFNFSRRGYLYLADKFHKFALHRAKLWLCVLKKYADNRGVSKEKRLFAISKLIRWLKRSGLENREFVKMAHSWGFDVPSILRILTKS